MCQLIVGLHFTRTDFVERNIHFVTLEKTNNPAVSALNTIAFIHTAFIYSHYVFPLSTEEKQSSQLINTCFKGTSSPSYLSSVA